MSIIGSTAYPNGAEFVYSYLRDLKEFPGETTSIPLEDLADFFNSNEVGPSRKSPLPSQVEVDLPRFYSMRLNSTVLYDKHVDDKPASEAIEIYKLIESAFKDATLALNCSKLLTQATFAGPTVDFFQKFTNPGLKFLTTCQETTAVVVITSDSTGEPLNQVELYFHVIFPIQDFSKINEAVKPCDCPVLGYFLITRTILIPRESLKSASTYGASIKDTYSKYYPPDKQKVIEDLKDMIKKETLPKQPQQLIPGYCIIA